MFCVHFTVAQFCGRWGVLERRLPPPLQVIAEIEGGLNKWKESGRWEEKGILEQVANKEYTWTP